MFISLYVTFACGFYHSKKCNFVAELEHPIREAEHYLQNAKQILSEKAEKDGAYYNDSKYVRMAGDIAWNGVFIA
jgi:hypothetical protein